MRISESNMEHYRNEILEIAKHKLAFGLKNGKLIYCTNANCDLCDFDKPSSPCGLLRTLWLMKDYKESIVLTAKEKCFLEIVETGWLTRDIDGEIKSHTSKPRKLETCWTSVTDDFGVRTFNKELFSFITWEDEEPWSVEELMKFGGKR